MPTDDREQQFERALARLLRDASPDSQCPDAETLSAYHERTLPLDQMALWKEHISGCVLCQETLALVGQSENVLAEQWEENGVPVAAYEEMASMAMRAAAPKFSAAQKASGTVAAGAAATVLRAGSRARWRWIVPVGAVAAAVIAWVGVREMRIQHRSEVASVQTAQNLKTEPTLSAPLTSRADQLTDQGRKETFPSATFDQAIREKKISPVPPKAVPPAVAPAASGAAYGTANGVAGGVAGGIPGGVAASSNEAPKLPTLDRKSAKSAAPPATYSADTVKDRDAEKAAAAAPPPSPAVEARVATNAPAPEQKQLQKQQEEIPRGVSESVTVQVQNETVEVQSAPADAISAKAISNLPAQGKNFQDLMLLAAADQRYIVARGGKYAWRVGESGKIERSADHGKTWKP